MAVEHYLPSSNCLLPPPPTPTHMRDSCTVRKFNHPPHNILLSRFSGAWNHCFPRAILIEDFLPDTLSLDRKVNRLNIVRKFGFWHDPPPRFALLGRLQETIKSLPCPLPVRSSFQELSPTKYFIITIPSKWKIDSSAVITSSFPAAKVMKWCVWFRRGRKSMTSCNDTHTHSCTYFHLYPFRLLSLSLISYRPYRSSTRKVGFIHSDHTLCLLWELAFSSQIPQEVLERI